MVEPSGRARKLSLWKMVNLNKGHKLRCSSFCTALLFLGEIITIQPSSAKHRGFCEEFLYIQQPGRHAARRPLLQRWAQHTLASSIWPLLGARGCPPLPARCPASGRLGLPHRCARDQHHLLGCLGSLPPVGAGSCKASWEPKPVLNPQSAVSRGCLMERRPLWDCGGKLGHPWCLGCHRRWDTLGTGLTAPVGLGVRSVHPSAQPETFPGRMSQQWAGAQTGRVLVRRHPWTKLQVTD